MRTSIELMILVLFDMVSLPLLYRMSEACWKVVRPLSASQLPIYTVLVNVFTRADPHAIESFPSIQTNFVTRTKCLSIGRIGGGIVGFLSDRGRENHLRSKVVAISYYIHTQGSNCSKTARGSSAVLPVGDQEVESRHASCMWDWKETLLDPSVGGGSALSSKILDFWFGKDVFL